MDMRDGRGIRDEGARKEISKKAALACFPACSPDPQSRVKVVRFNMVYIRVGRLL